MGASKVKSTKLQVMYGSGNVFADFGRFTVDRLRTILNRLGREVNISVDVKRQKKKTSALADLAI